jgi:Zn-finger nucleic acid-binding protein
MNCANCGAVMELADSGRHLRCAHCGTSHFPDSADADDIRVVGRAAGAPHCPACITAMDAALLDGDRPIHFCGRCRGVLLPRPTFAATISGRRAWASGPPAAPVPLDRRSLERKLSCPRCQGLFETYPHSGPGNVVIDSCLSCDLIWLDYGEMKRIVDAPGRDRGSRQIPRTDDTYVRKGEEDATDREDPVRNLFDLLFGNAGRRDTPRH